MIKSFRDKETEDLFNDRLCRRFLAIHRVARRKLEILDAAKNISDLRSPPGNRLESLTHNRVGQHSIRVNDQWRICFRWNDGEVLDVEIIDYH